MDNIKNNSYINNACKNSSCENRTYENRTYANSTYANSTYANSTYANSNSFEPSIIYTLLDPKASIEDINKAELYLYEYSTKMAKSYIRRNNNIDFYDNSYDKEDYYVDVYLRAKRDLSLFDEEAGGEMWMRNVCSHVLHEIRRKNAKRLKIATFVSDVSTDEEGNEYNTVDSYVTAASSEEVCLKKMFFDELYGRLDELIPNRREAIVNCAMLGKKPKDYAEEIGCSAKKISNDLARGRDNIRELMVEDIEI